MMDYNVVLMNELSNDGSTAHLYYSPIYKVFVAYGISAYIVTKSANGVMASYDSNQQMPIVIINEENVRTLKLGTRTVASVEGEYLRIEIEKAVDEENYRKWAGHLRSLYSASFSSYI